jgi:tocopherol cyclase
MTFRLFDVWRPEKYHGKGKKGNFFEGWFYKIVDAAQQHIFAIIPGVHINQKKSESYAFIQILNGQNHQSSYHRFPMTEFNATKNHFEVHIGANIFRADSIKLNLNSPDQVVQGQLHFENLIPWPVTLTSPGGMGWYAFIPFMECYHGVLSFDHLLKGTLSFNEQAINFTEGRGYLEKDWGKSFPAAYVWIQSNHFDQPGISLMVSVAKIPWLSGWFRGFIIGFYYRRKLYRFTTYNGAQLNAVTITDTDVHVETSNRDYRLVIQAIRSSEGLLHAPYDNQMLRRVSESLGSRVSVRFYQCSRSEDSLVFSGEGVLAGLEVQGEVKALVE